MSYGIPSHDTMSRFMRMIDENALLYEAMDWMAALVKSVEGHIILDGKGIRAAIEKNRGQLTQYIMNAVDAQHEFVIGQIKIDEKTNEISGIMQILQLLELKNQTVTIDAIGTQTKIVDEILNAGGHIVLPVKKNQGTTQDSIADYMCNLIKDKEKVKDNPNYESDYKEAMYTYVESEKGHGRYDKREYYLSYNTDCMKGTGFNGIEAVGYVIRTRKIERTNRDGTNACQESREETAYIMDSKLSVEEFAKFVRSHWFIENKLHWVLDNTFKEDRSTIRKGNALANTSLLRKISYDIIRLCKEDNQSFEYMCDDFRDNLEYIKKYIKNGIESLY